MRIVSFLSSINYMRIVWFFLLSKQVQKEQLRDREEMQRGYIDGVDNGAKGNAGVPVRGCKKVACDRVKGDAYPSSAIGS